MDGVYGQMLGMALMAVMILIVVGLGTYLAYLTGEKVGTRPDDRTETESDRDERTAETRTPATTRD